uniref:Uncharacterized protein n=1 Tax=Molossus molossus TaxID=27622 RepID=A0A7J8I135_MOLMO|nr:hypothetical protein HJG59_010742 [Molossus molossus]
MRPLTISLFCPNQRPPGRCSPVWGVGLCSFCPREEMEQLGAARPGKLGKGHPTGLGQPSAPPGRCSPVWGVGLCSFCPREEMEQLRAARPGKLGKGHLTGLGQPSAPPGLRVLVQSLWGGVGPAQPHPPSVLPPPAGP